MRNNQAITKMYENKNGKFLKFYCILLITMQNMYEVKNCTMHETKISKLITQLLKPAPSLAPNPPLR